ncbi:hypothetical protein F5146DRAFT_997622 [Armillaria mellea]|nr:hypothetical protein F5146DRAFT_997622 [Armillaria mellea]
MTFGQDTLVADLSTARCHQELYEYIHLSGSSIVRDLTRWWMLGSLPTARLQIPWSSRIVPLASMTTPLPTVPLEELFDLDDVDLAIVLGIEHAALGDDYEMQYYGPWAAILGKRLSGSRHTHDTATVTLWYPQYTVSWDYDPLEDFPTTSPSPEESFLNPETAERLDWTNANVGHQAAGTPGTGQKMAGSRARSDHMMCNNPPPRSQTPIADPIICSSRIPDFVRWRFSVNKNGQRTSHIDIVAEVKRLGEKIVDTMGTFLAAIEQLQEQAAHIFAGDPSLTTLGGLAICSDFYCYQDIIRVPSDSKSQGHPKRDGTYVDEENDGGNKASDGVAGYSHDGEDDYKKDDSDHLCLVTVAAPQTPNFPIHATAPSPTTSPYLKTLTDAFKFPIRFNILDEIQKAYFHMINEHIFETVIQS